MDERRATRLLARLLKDPVSLTAYALISVQMVFRLVTVGRSYYWQDDFAHLVLMHDEGLKWSTVVRDYNDHLEILNNLVYWLLSRSPTTHFWPAAVVILVLQIAASFLMWQLLRHLLGSRPSLLIVFSVYLFSPLMLVGALWLAAAVQILWLQIAMLGALWCLFRWSATRERGWLLGTYAFHVLGLLAWEKALVVLPVMLAAHVLLAQRGSPLGARARTIARDWRFWGAHLFLWLGYLVLYLSVTDGSEKGLGTPGVNPVTAAMRTLFGMMVPGMFGAPWSATGAENTQYPTVSILVQVLCALAVLVLVGLSVFVAGRRALEPWLLLVLYVAGDLALLLWGRAGFLDLVARDPRYIADAIPVACVCVAVAFQRTRDDPCADEASRPIVITQPVSASLAVVLTASCLLTGIQLAPVVERTYSRDYVRTLVEEYDRYPNRAVVDTVTTTQIGYVTQSQLLRAVGEDAPFNKPARRMYMFDSLAAMRVIDLRELVISHSGPQKDCGYPVSSTPVDLGTLPPDDRRRDMVVRLGYVTGVVARIRLRVGRNPWQALQVRPGVGYAWFVVPNQSGRVQVQALGLVGVCISDIDAGQPWPADG